jgi:hypothetical protein
MKLPINDRIALAQKMLPELDPEQVADAVLEMKSSGNGTAAIRADYNKAIASKEVKVALKSHAAALRRVLSSRRALQRKKTGAAYGVMMALSKSDEVIQKDLATVERMLQQKAEKPTRFEPLARVAVKTAQVLLVRAKRPATVARNSDWCKLSAILHGEPNRDFFNIVLEYRTESGSKIVPD